MIQTDTQEDISEEAVLQTVKKNAGANYDAGRDRPGYYLALVCICQWF